MMQTGDEYFDSKEFRDILTSYEESVRSGLPIFMDADDLTDIADYYNYTGDTDRANEVIDFALNMNPGATTPLVFKARAALENENIALAEELAEKIIDKDDPDYKYLKAEILIAQNKIDKAEEFLNEYSETIEQDEYEDFIIDVANLYADYGVYDMAYKWMNIGNESQLPEYKELKARVLFGMEMYSDSAKVYNELIDSNPYSKRYWNSLASAQFMNEDYDEAITSSEYAIAIDPKDSYGLLAKANSLYRL
ncbi:tetratricopeptide repeat protein, partial [Xylanibacter rodentium]